MKNNCFFFKKYYDILKILYNIYNNFMGNYEDNYLAKRPQSLCRMCGKCCRVVTTSTPYVQLKEMAENGDEGAADFLSIFEPYKSIDAAKAVDAGIVDNIINMLSQDGNYNEKEISFYYCKYLQDDNMCSRYNERLTLCKHFPSSPWAIVPPGCGFEGWLFLKREEDKQKVRKAKEELLELQLLRSRTTNKETLKKITVVEQKIQRNIDYYKKYGSENW